MTFDYHVERRIRLDTESEFKSLYSWSLNEIDDNGNSLGQPQIPWQWSVYFFANLIECINTIQPNQSPDDFTPFEFEQRIRAKLRPGYFNGSVIERDIRLSMFGTNRPVEDIALIIEPIDSDRNEEFCHIWASLGYTSEVDFRNENTPDTIEISICLARERFSQLANAIYSTEKGLLNISVSHVSGFYSSWSPSIRTDEIKVLGNPELKIITPPDCKIDPPRVGAIGDFSVYLTHKIEIEEPDDDSSKDEELDDVDVVQRSDKSSASSLISQKEFVDLFDRSIKSLKKYLIALIGLLLLMVFLSIFGFA